VSEIFSDRPMVPRVYDFASAGLKVQWAKIHINQLSAVINAFLSVSPESSPPVDIFLLIGDIVHSLRSSLDHIATWIVGNGSYV